MSETRKTHPVVTAIGVIVVLGLIGGAVYLVIQGAIKDPALIGSLVTAFATVVAVVIGRERETRSQLRQQHRERISPMYIEMTERLRESSAETAMEFFRKWQTGLLLDAPAEVIQAWLIWSRTFGDWDMASEMVYRPIQAATENVLLAVRKDLGHSDSTLAYGDLQRIYLNSDLADAVFGPFPHPLPLDKLGVPEVPAPPEPEPPTPAVPE